PPGLRADVLPLLPPARRLWGRRTRRRAGGLSVGPQAGWLSSAGAGEVAGPRIAGRPLAPEGHPELLEPFGAPSAQAGARQYVPTNHGGPALEAALARWPRLRAVVLGRGGEFRARAAAWLDAQVAGPGLDLVQDTFGHLVGWFQSAAADVHRTVRLVTTQYT